MMDRVDTPAPASERGRVRTRIRAVAVALLVAFLVALGGSLWYLTSSTQGANWIVGILTQRLPPLTRAEVVEGSLRGPLVLRDVQLEGATWKSSIEQVRLRVRIRPLFSKRVVVEALDAAGIEFSQTSSPAHQVSDATNLATLPWSFEVADFTLRDATVGLANDTLHIQQLLGSTVGIGDSIVFRDIRARVDDSNLIASGVVKPFGTITFRTEVSGTVAGMMEDAIEGSFVASGTLDSAEVSARIDAPFRTRASGVARNLTDEPSIEADVLVDEFPLALVGDTVGEDVVRAELFVTGHLEDLRARGTMQLISASMGQLDGAGLIRRTPGQVHFDSFLVRQLGTPGQLLVSGRVGTEPGETIVSLMGEWRSLQLPSKGTPIVRSDRGTLTIDGRLDAFDVTAAGSMRRPGQPPARVRLAARGDRNGLVVQQFAARLADGSLDARGVVSWDGDPSARLNLTATSLPVGILVGDTVNWRGRVDGIAEVSVQRRPSGFSGFAQVRDISGILRGAPLTGSGVLTFDPNSQRGDSLQVAWGDASLSGDGERRANGFDLNLSADVPDLGLVLPGAAGSVRGDIKVGGTFDAPTFNIDVNGSGLSHLEYSASRLRGVADVDLDGGTLVGDIELDSVEVRGRLVGDVGLVIDGVTDVHEVTAVVDGPLGHARVEARGGLERDDTWRWLGQLNAVDVTSELGQWQLFGETDLDLARGASTIDSLCLTSDESTLCGIGFRDADDTFEVGLSLIDFPLDRLDPWLPGQWRFSGPANGTLSARKVAGAELEANALVEIQRASIRYPVEGEARALSIEQTQLVTVLDEAGLRAALTSRLEDDSSRAIGTVAAQVQTLEPISSLAALRTAQIAGSVRGSLEDVGLVEALSPQIADVSGQLELDVNLSGTLDTLLTTGHAALVDGRARIPELGIELTDVGFRADGDGTNQLTISGGARSGGGRVEFTGSAGVDIDQSTPLRVRVDGRDFVAARTPGVDITVHPSLEVTATRELVSIVGEVEVPRASIALLETPEFAIRSSGDVVFIDAATSAAAGPQIRSEVRVVLGDSVRVEGVGFRGRARGSVLVRDEPSATSRATGELRLLEGIYRAYGQDLTVERARLVYAESPLDNPGIDARAYRRTSDATIAGVNVTGTLRDPTVALYSEPTMAESDALSYLVLGHRFGAADDSERDRLANAIGTIGLQGSNVFAQRIGAQLGLDVFGLETGPTLEQTALVAGAYLSPRLFLSYGLGLFDNTSTFRLRYVLSSRWSLQSETGSASGADLFYRIEAGS